MAVTDILKQKADAFGIDVSPELCERLEIYASQLKEINQHLNLTAITDDEGIAVKHFLDCLALFKYTDLKKNAALIDVGTGAGFPGLVIAAARDDIAVTLLDSTGKKLKAVSEIAAAMGLKNCTVLHARAEEAGRNKEYRERFDYATARAVARLQVLSEYCLPFVSVGGSFISMKGASADEEIAAADNALKVLGGQIEKVNTFDLCGEGERAIINIKKISRIGAEFPRASTKISSKPL